MNDHELGQSNELQIPYSIRELSRSVYMWDPGPIYLIRIHTTFFTACHFL